MYNKDVKSKIMCRIFLLLCIPVILLDFSCLPKANSEKKEELVVDKVDRKYFVNDSLQSFCFLESYSSPQYVKIRTSNFLDSFSRCNFTKGNNHFTFLERDKQFCHQVREISYDPSIETVAKRGSEYDVSYRQVNREEFFDLFRASTEGLYFSRGDRLSIESFPRSTVLTIPLDSLPDYVPKFVLDEIVDLGDDTYMYPKYFFDINISHTGKVASKSFVTSEKVGLQLQDYLMELVDHRKFETVILLDNEPVNTAYRLMVTFDK